MRTLSLSKFIISDSPSCCKYFKIISKTASLSS